MDDTKPAGLGVDNKNILNDTYRKAWKMDNDNFSTRLAVESAGIMDLVVPISCILREMRGGRLGRI